MSTVTWAASSCQGLFPEDNRTDTLTQYIVSAAIHKQEEVGPNIVAALSSGYPALARKYFNYGRDKYHWRLPKTTLQYPLLTPDIFKTWVNIPNPVITSIFYPISPLMLMALDTTRAGNLYSLGWHHNNKVFHTSITGDSGNPIDLNPYPFYVFVEMINEEKDDNTRPDIYNLVIDFPTTDSATGIRVGSPSPNLNFQVKPNRVLFSTRFTDTALKKDGGLNQNAGVIIYYDGDLDPNNPPANHDPNVSYWPPLMLYDSLDRETSAIWNDYTFYPIAVFHKHDNGGDTQWNLRPGGTETDWEKTLRELVKNIGIDADKFWDEFNNGPNGNDGWQNMKQGLGVQRWWMSVGMMLPLAPERNSKKFPGTGLAKAYAIKFWEGVHFHLPGSHQGMTKWDEYQEQERNWRDWYQDNLNNWNNEDWIIPPEPPRPNKPGVSFSVSEAGEATANVGSGFNAVLRVAYVVIERSTISFQTIYDKYNALYGPNGTISRGPTINSASTTINGGRLIEYENTVVVNNVSVRQYNIIILGDVEIVYPLMTRTGLMGATFSNDDGDPNVYARFPIVKEAVDDLPFKDKEAILQESLAMVVGLTGQEKKQWYMSALWSGVILIAVAVITVYTLGVGIQGLAATLGVAINTAAYTALAFVVKAAVGTLVQFAVLINTNNSTIATILGMLVTAGISGKGLVANLAGLDKALGQLSTANMGNYLSYIAKQVYSIYSYVNKDKIKGLEIEDPIESEEPEEEYFGLKGDTAYALTRKYDNIYIRNPNDFYEAAYFIGHAGLMYGFMNDFYNYMFQLPDDLIKQTDGLNRERVF